MGFDFDAAVSAPFRMQPGLRKMAPGQPSLTPQHPGTAHHREKLQVLGQHWQQALVARPGFDAGPALQALFQHAQLHHANAWQWNGLDAQAPLLGLGVDHKGAVSAEPANDTQLQQQAQSCLLNLPTNWRHVALFALAFEEDLAIVDGVDATIPWLAVALPSHWAPEARVGGHFAQVHASVADNALLLKAAQSLVKLVCEPQRWERFVWTITDHSQLQAHPLRCLGPRWQHAAVDQAHFRTEHQTFLPVAAHRQAVFTIRVHVQPLAQLIGHSPERAQRLHDAVASMSPAVLAYRSLHTVREPLLRWLQELALIKP